MSLCQNYRDKFRLCFKCRNTYQKPSMNFDIDNFLVQAYAKQFKDLNKSTGTNQNYVIKVNM